MKTVEEFVEEVATSFDKLSQDVTDITTELSNANSEIATLKASLASQGTLTDADQTSLDNVAQKLVDLETKLSGLDVANSAPTAPTV